MQSTTNLAKRHRPLWKKMILTVCFITAIFLHSNANVIYTAQQKIIIKESKISLSKLLWKIEKASGYDFVFNSEKLKKI